MTGQKTEKGCLGLAKGGLNSESEIRFSNLQNKLLQITILSFNFEIPAHNSNSFKFLAQDSDLE